MLNRITVISAFIAIFLPVVALPQNDKEQIQRDSLYILEHYEKREVQIPMRDGVKLFTSVYSPKDKSQRYPIMLNRTPYSVRPYGEGVRPQLGPSMLFAKEKFIFIYQDVRGCYMSEGVFENMRPQIAKKKSKRDIDESTDTYDTIEWLVKNIPNNNGKVGMWGISYPGFYTAVGTIDAHPALVAASPQAPIADWFIGDDFHHHGAFFLPHAFNFFASFGLPRPKPTTQRNARFHHGTPDGYRFFLEEIGPLKNANEKFLKGRVAFWNDIIEHPNYDEFWQARNLLPHLKNIKPAVMTVGGWFDAEDLYGPLKIYRQIEKSSSGAFNVLVMGPWRHGGWARDDGSTLGNVFFADNPPPSYFYQENIELPFFLHYLKGKAKPDLPEAYVFETGVNKWRRFKTWPPQGLQPQNLYLAENGKLVMTPEGVTTNVSSFDEFISDPAKPVPFTETITTNMTIEYMTDDQRFAARRPDVLVYQTEPLAENVTLAGAMMANLWVSTTAGDADWVVKLIDVYPDDHPNFPHNPEHIKMGGYQQMVRSEVFRGRFRNSYEKPEPFVSNEIFKISFELQDVLHTFKAGHRIMVQVQSTWFPLVDRNPQKWVDNIFKAEAEDFVKATHRVYFGAGKESGLEVGILK